MSLDDIIYLKSILGEYEARKYLKAGEDKLEILVDVLKSSNVKKSLDRDALNEFCYKLAFGKYGTVYTMVLHNIGKFNMMQLEYLDFLGDYMEKGYNQEQEYKNLFHKHIPKLSEVIWCPVSLEKVQPLIEKEITDVQNQITVDKFIENGGSLEELMDILKDLEIEHFNGNTKIPNFLLKTKKKEKFQVSITQIGFLVSILPSLKLDDKTMRELFETYHEILEQSKETEFKTDIFVVEDKPNLYTLLKSKNMIAEIIEPEKNKRKNRTL